MSRHDEKAGSAVLDIITAKDWMMNSTDRIPGLLAQFPGPVTLHSLRKGELKNGLIGAVFTTIGIFKIFQGERMGWLLVLCFGAVLTYKGVTVFWAGLTLDKEGFEARSIVRHKRYHWRWAETDGFDARAITDGIEDPSEIPKSNYCVVFDDLTDAPKTEAYINASVTGRNAGLLGTYGFAPDELAYIMAVWRERALTMVEHSPAIG